MPHPAIRFLYHGLSRHPGVIIGIIVGAFLLSFGAFTHIEIDDDFEVGITDPQAQAARALYRQHFQHEQAILVALPIAGLTRENLLSLWDLTNELQQLPEVNRVMSILNLLRPCRKREEFERYLRDFRLRNLEELIRRDDLFRGFLVNGDLTALQILVVPDVQVDNYRHKLYKGLNGILSRHAKPGAAHVFGFPYIQERFFEFIVENNQRFLTIGFIGCAILAWFLFPDPVILLLILFAIAAPTVFTFAVYFMNGNKINLFTSPIIPFTLIISLNEIIYIISFFVAERKRDDQTYSLLHEQNFHRLIRPCLINTATTLIGFLSLSQSPSQSIRLFSLYTSLACLFSYLVTFSLIFAFLRLYKPRFSLSSHQRPKFPWLERLQKRLVFRYPIAILCITAVSIALAVPLLHSYERRNSLSDNFATDDPLLSSHAFIRDRFCGPSHLQVLVSHPNLLQTKQLLALATLQDRLARLDGINRVLSLVDLLKSFNREFTGDHRLPATEDLARAVIRFFASRGVAEMLVNPEFTIALLRVYTPLTDDFQIVRLREAILAAASATLPADMNVDVTGDVYLNAVLQQNILENITWSFAAAVTMIIGVFWLVFRRFSMAFIALVVNFAPILGAYVIARQLGIPLNPSTAVVGCVMSGLIVDDTLHLLTFYQDTRQPTTVRRLLSTMRDLSGPVSSSSVLLALGNAIFIFSPFKPFLYFGLIGTLIVGIGLIGDLIVLPAMILVFGQKKNAPALSRESTGAS